jgi:hypothetical protein
MLQNIQLEKRTIIRRKNVAVAVVHYSIWPFTLNTYVKWTCDLHINIQLLSSHKIPDPRNQEELHARTHDWGGGGVGGHHHIQKPPIFAC